VASDCVFCKIIAGGLEASVPYEDESVIAFLDLRQFNPGHTLVVPKHHVGDIFDLDEPTGAALMSALIRLASGVESAVDADGINIVQSNGEAAGQEVFHLHFHVVPRHANDGLLQFYPSKPGYPPRAELDSLAERIRTRLKASA
jgi:histidine triad (HIT) family protein